MTTRKQDTLRVVHASPDAASVAVTLWTRAREMDGAFYAHRPRTHVWGKDQDQNKDEASEDGWVVLDTDASISAWVLIVGDRITSLGILPQADSRVALQLIQTLQARLPTLRVTLTSDGANSSRRNEWAARYQSVGFRVRASSFSSAGAISLAWSALAIKDESLLAADVKVAAEVEAPPQSKRRTVLKCESFDRNAWPVALIRKPPTLTLYHGSPTWAVLQQFVIEVEPKVRRFFASQNKQPRNNNLEWVEKSTLAKNLFPYSHQLKKGNPNPDAPRLHLNIVMLACIAEFVKRGYTGDLVEGVLALVNTTNAYSEGAHPLLVTAQEFARIGSWDKLVSLGKTNVCKLALETQQALFCGAQTTALTYAKKESSFLYTYTLHSDQRTASWFVRLNDPKTLWGMLADGMPFGVQADEDQAAKDSNVRYKYSPEGLVNSVVSATADHIGELRDKYRALGGGATDPEDEVGHVLIPALLRLDELYRFKEPRVLDVLARVRRDGLVAHASERDALLEDVFDVMKEYRTTPILKLLANTDDGIGPSMTYHWDKLFEVPLSSRSVVWVGMYPEFFGGAGKRISRVSYYENDAMLVSMFVNSNWYQANKACIIGWFGNSQHEWVVADPQARGVLTKETPGINIAGPIDIFRKFEDYESYE
jgi:hypothetical protein